jgi:hypothetical protein
MQLTVSTQQTAVLASYVVESLLFRLSTIRLIQQSYMGAEQNQRTSTCSRSIVCYIACKHLTHI